jgi:hypothetical protein
VLENPNVIGAAFLELDPTVLTVLQLDQGNADARLVLKFGQGQGSNLLSWKCQNQLVAGEPIFGTGVGWGVLKDEEQPVEVGILSWKNVEVICRVNRLSLSKVPKRLQVFVFGVEIELLGLLKPAPRLILDLYQRALALFQDGIIGHGIYQGTVGGQEIWS